MVAASHLTFMAFIKNRLIIKAPLSPLGAYLISGTKGGGGVAFREGGLIERGGLISNHTFSTKFTIRFSTLTVIPITNKSRTRK